MKFAGIWALFGLALVVMASPVSAQEELELRVIPRFGLMDPDPSFYDRWKNFSGDGYVEWTAGSLGRAAYVGVGVELEQGDRGFLLRAELARTFDGWHTAGHGVLIPRVYYEPPQVVNTWFDQTAAITFLSLQLILPTRLEFKGIQPYVMGGYSSKWYSFGEPSQANEVEAYLPEDGFTPGVEMGGGVTFGLFGLTFDAQVKDTINRYWGKTQHDLVYSGGLIWQVR